MLVSLIHNIYICLHHYKFNRYHYICNTKILPGALHDVDAKLGLFWKINPNLCKSITWHKFIEKCFIYNCCHDTCPTYPPRKVLRNMVFFCCLVGYGLVAWILILHSIHSRLIGNFDLFFFPPIQPTKHSPASTKVQSDCPPHSEQPGRPLSRQHRRRRKSNVDVNHKGKPKAKWKK